MPDNEERIRIQEQLQVLRAQTGDTDALCQLFQEYNEKLLYYLRRLIGEQHDVEDVLQEVWMLVWRKISTLEEPSAFRSWLYRVARNRAISRCRKSKQMPTQEALDESTLIQETELDERELLSQFDAASIHAALALLSPNHCEVLTLRFLEQLAYEEIALIVGCTIGTVRSRIHYAKQSIKKILIESKSKKG